MYFTMNKCTKNKMLTQKDNNTTKCTSKII